MQIVALMSPAMNTDAIKRAVELVGGQTAMARQLGVSQGLIWHWCVGRLKVRAERCGDIEVATGGQVTCHDLRPDVFRPAETQNPTTARAG